MRRPRARRGEWYPPWRFVSVILAGDKLGDTQKLLKRLMVEAGKTGASRIVLRVPNGGLLSESSISAGFGLGAGARLCSLNIERHHLDAFPLLAQ